MSIYLVIMALVAVAAAVALVAIVCVCGMLYPLLACPFAYVCVLLTHTHTLTLAVFAAFRIEIKFTCDFS